MGGITAFSLLVLWITLLPLEGRTTGSQLLVDSISTPTPLNQPNPTPLYQATHSSTPPQNQVPADAVVADLQKLASSSSLSSRQAAVDILHHISPAPKMVQRTAPKRSTPHKYSKRSVFDILPNRLKVKEEEWRRSSRLVQGLSSSSKILQDLSSSSRIWKVKLAKQSKLKRLIRKLVRKYLLIEKIKLIRDGKSGERIRSNTKTTTRSSISSQNNH